MEPPPYPPPILDKDQTHALIVQGYAPIKLSPRLSELYQRLFDCMKEFFKRPLEEKQRVYPPTHETELGYYSIPGEKDYLTLRHLTYHNSELECLAAELWKETAILLYRVLVSISFFLNLSAEAWRPLLDGCLTMAPSKDQMTTTFMRLFDYLPNAGQAEAHADNGILTLCVSSSPGLQVCNLQETTGINPWSDAQYVTVLIGATLKALLPWGVNVGYHRVVGNPSGRNSIVFGLRPSIKNKLDLTAFGGEGIVDMKDFWRDLMRDKFNVNAQPAIRERQKKERREKLLQHV